MEEQELFQYRQMSVFQKNIVDALVNIGFTYKYGTTYELVGWGDIKVSDFNRLSDLLKKVYEQGKDQKRFE